MGTLIIAEIFIDINPINGANNFGINSIFVETGIHKDEIINTIDNVNLFNSYLDKKPSQMNIIKTLKI